MQEVFPVWTLEYMVSDCLYARELFGALDILLRRVSALVLDGGASCFEIRPTVPDDYIL